MSRPRPVSAKEIQRHRELYALGFEIENLNCRIDRIDIVGGSALAFAELWRLSNERDGLLKKREALEKEPLA